MVDALAASPPRGDAAPGAGPAAELILHAPGRGPLEAPPGARVAAVPLPSQVVFGAAAILGRPRLGAGADVVWLPAPAPVAVAPGVPYVLTLHDLSWEERPDDLTRYERLFHRLARPRALARRAAAVVAVSAATRDVAAARWGVEARVIHPGVPPLPAPDAAGLPPLPERFVLAVGALEPRKDPLFLVAAWREARRRGLDAELVFAGGGGRLAGAIEGAQVVTGATRAQLAHLYDRALALAMPSRLEGFGFPPLEAARAGTPAVVSDLPVFAETLGDAALRVAPGDRDAWAAALIEVVSQRADPAVAARFAWDRAARELRAVLAEAAA